MNKIKDTVIIIPAYNEEKVIEGVLEDTLKVFQYVIVVNDGSQDGTSTEAQKTKAIVIDHFMNAGGQGGALQTGIEYALSLPVKYFVTFDADGQHQIKDVLKMRDEIVKGNYDIVIGSRFLGVEAKNMPRSKKVLLKMAVRFSNLTSGLKLTDTHNGLRMFNREVASTIDIEEVGYQHASEITEKIAKNKWRYKEIPIEIIYSEYSKNKGQSLLNAVNIGSDILIDKVIK